MYQNVSEKYEECNLLSEIDIHLQFWENMTGSILFLSELRIKYFQGSVF